MAFCIIVAFYFVFLGCLVMYSWDLCFCTLRIIGDPSKGLLMPPLGHGHDGLGLEELAERVRVLEAAEVGNRLERRSSGKKLLCAFELQGVYLVWRFPNFLRGCRTPATRLADLAHFGA